MQTFLALDEPFLPLPERTEPRIWLEHVRICASPEHELRRLRLTPGLNIVWAPDARPEERLGTRIGHGAGKTLLCRLLRHALGEPDLASPDDAAAIRRALPAGYVEAEVHVGGTRWAVRRPFDPKAASVALRGAALVDLDQAEPQPYAAFLEAARATLGASSEALGGAGDPWLAALAWMSRDQERRFGGPLRWRDRVASPGSKIARVSNLERVRALRSFLRLRGSDDVVAERRVSELELAEKTTIQRLAQCEREVTWLSLRLAREGVGDASELAGQPLVVRAAITTLEATLDGLDGSIEEPEALREARARHEAMVRAEAESATLLALREASLAALRAHAEHASEASCSLCLVPVAWTLERSAALRRDPVKSAERELARSVKHLAHARRRLERARKKLDTEADRHRTGLREDRRRWADARDRSTRTRELERQLHKRTELATDLAAVQREIAEARDDRERALREHGKRLGRVADVYDFVVRRIAGQEASGRFALGASSLDACIHLPDGRSGTSPALRVMETLALDLTALVLACEDRADLPGLLVHDSPREADLARSHYDALYRLVSWLETATGTPGFQYIVTTTTSPPKSVAFRAMRLGAAANDELLLRTALRR